MSDPILIKKYIFNSLKTAEGLYHRLVLLVGEAGTGKTRVLVDVADELGTTVINVNLKLAGELLELTAKQRLLRVPTILEQITQEGKSTLVLDNLEILLDKNLKQDPLRLLQGFSRNRMVLTSWNGTFTGSRLLYAEPGHTEYCSYDSGDALMVGMDGKTTVDLAKEQ